MVLSLSLHTTHLVNLTLINLGAYPASSFNRLRIHLPFCEETDLWMCRRC